MPEEPREEITILLRQVAEGNKAAEEQLIGLVYEKLRKMAGALMRKERSFHSLQPTALVAEIYIKLFFGKPLQASNRAHFFGAAAKRDAAGVDRPCPEKSVWQPDLAHFGSLFWPTLWC